MSTRGLIAMVLGVGFMLVIDAGIALWAGWAWVGAVYGIAFAAIAVLLVQEYFEGR